MPSQRKWQAAQSQGWTTPEPQLDWNEEYPQVTPQEWLRLWKMDFKQGFCGVITNCRSGCWFNGDRFWGLHDELTSIVGSIASYIEQLEEEKKKLESNVENLEHQVLNLKEQQRNNASQTREAVQEAIRQTEDRLARQYKDHEDFLVAGHTKKTKEMEQIVDDLQKEVRKLAEKSTFDERQAKRDVKESKNRLATLEADNANLKGEVNGLKRDVASRQETIISISEATKEKDKKLEAAAQVIGGLTRNIKRIERELEEKMDVDKESLGPSTIISWDIPPTEPAPLPPPPPKKTFAQVATQTEARTTGSSFAVVQPRTAASVQRELARAELGFWLAPARAVPLNQRVSLYGPYYK